MEKKIILPLTRELARTLKAGDSVLLTGTIYTSRDAGHKRMCEALARGEKLPFDPTDATIYYVGPTPAKPGQVIRLRRPHHLRPYGRLRPHPDACGREGHDRQGCETARGRESDEGMRRRVFRRHRRCRERCLPSASREPS